MIGQYEIRGDEGASGPLLAGLGKKVTVLAGLGVDAPTKPTSAPSKATPGATGRPGVKEGGILAMINNIPWWGKAAGGALISTVVGYGIKKLIDRGKEK